MSSSPSISAADEPDPPSRVARLGYLRGPVSFQPAGEADWVPAIANRPLTTGDRLWTDAGARAELNTGSTTIRLDAGTDFSFLNLDDRTAQMQVTQGTVTIRVRWLRRGELVEVDTPNQAFSILRPGSYRVDASEDGFSTLVTVRDGEGEASGGGETYTVHSGQSTRFTGTDRLDAINLRMSRVDEFEQWGELRDRRTEESRSARYVSRDVVGYEDLDDHGTWHHDPGYGDVWVPTQVAPGWAPYRSGHWAWIAPWGYTWVDDAPWGYAPFHYGRWVTVGGRWGWVPGPRTVEAVYAPALVAFIGGPSFSLSVSVGGGGPPAEVGWFPLGPREVYVPAYHVSRGYVDRVNVSNTTVSTTTITNVYNTQINNEYRTTNVTYVNRTAPGAVTVVPQQAFIGAQPVARVAVRVNEQRLAAAPVGRTAAAAPTRSSVFGASVSRAESAPRPPAAVATRSVVARTPPPPAPVPFARQQQALQAHPGQPLARHEVESARPPDAAAARPRVRQAAPGRPAAARDDRTPATAKEPATMTTPQAVPPKAAERPTQQPAPPKAAERQAQQPVPPKAVESPAPQPVPPKAVERPAQQPVPTKAAKRQAQQPVPSKAAERQAQQPVSPKAAERRQQVPPKAAPDRAADQPRRPAASSRPAKLDDDEDERDGRPSGEEKSPR